MNSAPALTRAPTPARVLLLNASFEPLCPIPWQRAVRLVFDDKADVIEQSTRAVNTPRSQFLLPAVVRLREYVRVPRHTAPYSKRGVLRRDQHRCAYCGKTARTVDHVVPRARGGPDSWQNCVACCSPCNERKADRTLAEMGWTLPFTPAAPSNRRWWVGVSLAPEWEPYVAGW